MATKTALPNGNGMTEKANTAKFQSQKAAVASKRPKTNSKNLQDEGLLATLGSLVCDHQLGAFTTFTSLRFSQSATNILCRNHRQYCHSHCPHTHILSPRKKSNRQVSAIVVLQSRNKTVRMWHRRSAFRTAMDRHIHGNASGGYGIPTGPSRKTWRDQV